MPAPQCYNALRASNGIRHDAAPLRPRIETPPQYVKPSYLLIRADLVLRQRPHGHVVVAVSGALLEICRDWQIASCHSDHLRCVGEVTPEGH